MNNEPIGQKALDKIEKHEVHCQTRAKSVDEKFEGLAKRLFRMETLIIAGFIGLILKDFVGN